MNTPLGFKRSLLSHGVRKVFSIQKLPRGQGPVVDPLEFTDWEFCDALHHTITLKVFRVAAHMFHVYGHTQYIHLDPIGSSDLRFRGNCFFNMSRNWSWGIASSFQISGAKVTKRINDSKNALPHTTQSGIFRIQTIVYRASFVVDIAAAPA